LPNDSSKATGEIMAGRCAGVAAGEVAAASRIVVVSSCQALPSRRCSRPATAGDAASRSVAIVVVATPRSGAALDPASLLAECKSRLPAYMVPGQIDVRPGPLPRNPNGKIDRKALGAEFDGLFEAAI